MGAVVGEPDLGCGVRIFRKALLCLRPEVVHYSRVVLIIGLLEVCEIELDCLVLR